MVFLADNFGKPDFIPTLNGMNYIYAQIQFFFYFGQSQFCIRIKKLLLLFLDKTQDRKPQSNLDLDLSLDEIRKAMAVINQILSKYPV